MRRIAILSLLLCLAVPLFATEPNASLRQRELVEKLLALMKLDTAGAAMTDAVYAQIEKQFIDQATANGNDPEDIAEAKERFQLFRAKAAKIDFAGLLHEEFIRIYAKYFTEQELTDLIAFYSTRTGAKTLEVMDDLMREGMQAGAEHLGPKIEEVMKQVDEEHAKKRPWRRTMSEILAVATAVEAYATDNDDHYPSGDYAGLKAQLEPTYLAKFPEKDIWGHEYGYVVSDDHTRYRLVSAGADSIFDWDSRRIDKQDPAADVRYRDRLEDDLIYGDGQWLQLPFQAKPKE